MSFELKDAPPEILKGIQRDRERSRRDIEEVEAKLEELDDKIGQFGRPSREESLRALKDEAHRLGMATGETDAPHCPQ